MTFYSIPDQLKLFTGHALNMDTMKIRLPNGSLVNSTAFNRLYTGDQFAMDVNNDRITQYAYAAYTKNMAYRPVMYWNETRNIPPMTERIP